MYFHPVLGPQLKPSSTIQMDYYSYTTAADISSWVKCCKCEREYDPVPWKSACPDCMHPKCDDCKPPRQPTPVPVDRVDYSQYYHTSRQHSRSFSEHAESGSSSTYFHTRRSLGHRHGVRDPRNQGRPSMRGWWKCCQCGESVNPAVNEDECPGYQCYHTRCNYYCSWYR